MNKVVLFFHQLFHPHCTHCMEIEQRKMEIERLTYLEKRNESKEDAVCESCETLKLQLEIANYEKDRLLNRLLEKPEVVESKAPQEMSKPRMISWKVRQQMLEAEDRKRAQIMREAPKPQPTTEELEKEFGVEVPDALHGSDAQVQARTASFGQQERQESN